MIYTHGYENGLTLLVEPIPGVASASLAMLLPAGAAREPGGRLGAASLLSELLLRGAGDLDARAHSEALDALGVHRDTEVLTHHLRLSATTLGTRLGEALPLLLEMVSRPRLPDAAFEPCRQLAIQSIESLDDNPQEKVMIELKRRHLGEPLGRSVLGELADLRAAGVEDVRAFQRSRFTAGGSILALAGEVEFERVRDHVGELLGAMGGDVGDEPDVVDEPSEAYHHVEAETQQQHIGVAYRTVGERDAACMVQRVATAVLSGGMSGRLFTEVRENRGLCYAVYASYLAQRGFGTIYAYAGTTTQRAAETLEVLTAELRRIAEGVERDEFERAIVGLKARVVMSGESTGARARAIAADQFLLGRPRTLDELAAEIDKVTLDDVNAFVGAHRPEAMTTLTIGPEALAVAR